MSRRLVLRLLLAGCLLAMLSGTSLAETGIAPAKMRLCGHVDGTVVISVDRGTVPCATARKVARRYLNQQQNHPLGYTCRRYTIDVAAGFYAKCRKGANVVHITPE